MSPHRSESSLTPVSDWQLATPHQARAQLTGHSDYSVKSIYLHAGEISPLTLYCYLVSTFGEPNGEQMAFRVDGSDNLVHWQFKISSRDVLVDLSSTSAGLQFIAHGTEAVSASHWQAMLSALRKEFTISGSGLKEIRSRLEKWTQFTNPFMRIRRAVMCLHKDLTQLNTEPPGWPPVGPINEPVECLTSYCEAATRARALGFSIRLLLPVLAESFVNLVLFVFWKGVRSSSEYAQAIRAPINERVLALPDNCIGFRRGIDASAMPYKQFLRLMNGRNDLVHGNCDPNLLRLGDVFFDDKIPLWTDDNSTILRMAQNGLKSLSLEEVEAEMKIVKEFAKWLAGRMESEYEAAMTRVATGDYLGLSVARGNVGILFENTIFESYLPNGE